MATGAPMPDISETVRKKHPIGTPALPTAEMTEISIQTSKDGTLKTCLCFFQVERRAIGEIQWYIDDALRVQDYKKYPKVRAKILENLPKHPETKSLGKKICIFVQK